MAITYYEYYPHYMGTMSATIKFTEAQFNKIVKLAKAAIKEDKNGDADDSREELEDFVEGIAKKQKQTTYAFMEAVIDSPRRPSTIATTLKKKGVWSDQWEEGSHAFSNKGAKVAKEAVRKIEAEHCLDGY